MTMRHPDGRQKLALTALIVSTVLVLIAGTALGIRLLISHNQTTVQSVDMAVGGFPMPGDPAPGFTLVDQFGHPVTLASLRGREVVLAFIDSRCTSLCPLTAEIMYDAKTRLGAAAASQVALVAINANPAATSIAVVQAWSINHGMLHQWLFLTGTAQQLQSIYHAYEVYDQVGPNGQGVHDPATFIIDAQGHERLYFETLDSTNKTDLNNQEIGLETGMRQWLPQPQ
jgi:cytochrome oxidase Cu insertion factor (SCO1/SenC/PrrC family)